MVTRRVKAGREAAYEAWLERLIRDAAALPGFLGAKVARPSIRGPRCALADAAATSART